MKALLQFFLQRLLGFERYLFWFCRFKVSTLRWDKAERHIFPFLASVPKEGLLLDVGANLGILSVHMCRLHPKQQVLAFEPMEKNRIVLKRIMETYGIHNISIFAMALGENKGTLNMAMPNVKGVRKQGLSHVVSAEMPAGLNDDLECVPVETLDDFLASDYAGVPVAAIKLDVENFESSVIRGAMATIERWRPWLVAELWDTENRKQVLKSLLPMGYSVFIFDGRALIPWHEGMPALNLIFKPSTTIL
jgi:FkbM family methyltransferase